MTDMGRINYSGGGAGEGEGGGLSMPNTGFYVSSAGGLATRKETLQNSGASDAAHDVNTQQTCQSCEDCPKLYRLYH